MRTFILRYLTNVDFVTNAFCRLLSPGGSICSFSKTTKLVCVVLTFKNVF